ncbi:ankyrin repeat-containing protein [Golden Marseillevirus]|uniref:ankyrin repeat-containing protein n=1 Tax=Golden Marseillevirus TaxID=1720526 RepID=UPI000877AAF6|nr:ankyrin repeat-containing protein [Golden Marseillevirus]ALX27590.1 ankyrin repeat-containing protein [Golden Marseillevirus]
MDFSKLYPTIREPRKMAFAAIKAASPKNLAIVLFVWTPTQEIFEFCIREYEAECQKQWSLFSKVEGNVSELFSDTIQGLSAKHPRLQRVLGLLNCIGTILFVSSYPNLSRQSASLQDKQRTFFGIKLPPDYAEYEFPVTNKKSLMHFAMEKGAKFYFSFLYKDGVASRVRWLCETEEKDFVYFLCLLSTIQELNGAYQGNTPLMSAVVSRNKEKLSQLSAFGACKNLNHPECDTNAMGRVKDVDTFLFLLKLGASPDIVDNSGFNLLSRLCSAQDTPKDLFVQVLEHSNPNVPQRVLPLVWALYKRDEELLRLLFEKGADPIYAEKTTELDWRKSAVWKEAKKYWDTDIINIKGESSGIAKARISLFVFTLQLKSEKCLWWLVKHSSSVSVQEAVQKREKTRPIKDLEGRQIPFGEFSDNQIITLPASNGETLGLLSSLVQEFVDKESKKPNPRYDRIDFFASRGVVVCVPLSSAMRLL